VRVRWTRHAAFDLADVVAFIAQDNPRAAIAVARKIRDAANRLPRFPRKGRVVPEFDNEAIREVIVGRYRVVYRLASHAIQILAVVEGHRLLPLELQHTGREETD
jgi:plasmid stabilization system protein ParE